MPKNAPGMPPIFGEWGTEGMTGPDGMPPEESENQSAVAQLGVEARAVRDVSSARGAQLARFLAKTELSASVSAKNVESQRYFNFTMWKENSPSGQHFADFLRRADQQMEGVRSNTSAYAVARQEDLRRIAESGMERDEEMQRLEDPEIIEPYKEPNVLAILLFAGALGFLFIAVLNLFGMATELAAGTASWTDSLWRGLGCLAASAVLAIPRIVYEIRLHRWKQTHMTRAERSEALEARAASIAQDADAMLPSPLAWCEENLEEYVDSLAAAVASAPETLPEPSALPTLAALQTVASDAAGLPEEAVAMRKALAAMPPVSVPE